MNPCWRLTESRHASVRCLYPFYSRYQEMYDRKKYNNQGLLSLADLELQSGFLVGHLLEGLLEVSEFGLNLGKLFSLGVEQCHRLGQGSFCLGELCFLWGYNL